MRVNEYFSYKGDFQIDLEKRINGTLQVDDPRLYICACHTEIQ